MMSRVLRRFANAGGGVVALALGVAGCRQPEPIPAASTRSAAPAVHEAVGLRVELAGCKGGERQRNTCTVSGEAELRLWVDGAQPDVAIDGSIIDPVSVVAVQGGTRVIVRVPGGARTLSIARAGSQPWSLQFDAPPPTPILDDLRARLPDQNDPTRTPRLAAALKELEAALARMSGFERVAALRLATVLAWDSGVEPTAYGRRAVDAALAYGDAALVVDAADIFFYMVDAKSLDAAWAVETASLYAANVSDVALLVRWRLTLGIHALDSGDTARGIEHLRTAEALSERAGLRAQQSVAVARLAVVFATHGREHQRAAAVNRLLELLDEPSGGLACADATSLANLAVSFVYARISGNETADPEPIVLRAIDRFETPGPLACAAAGNPSWRSTHDLARAGYVLAAVVREQWDQVASRLAWFDGREVTSPASAWVALSRVELALARGDIEAARRHLPAVTHDAEQTRWRAAILRGQVEEAAGRGDLALAAYEEAERIVDDMAWSVAIPEGTDDRLGLWTGAASAIRLHAAAGRIDEAVATARRSRSRVLRRVGSAIRAAALPPERRAAWRAAIAEYERLRGEIAAALATSWALPVDERASLAREVEARRTLLRDAQLRAFDLLDQGDASDSLASPADGEVWLVFHPIAGGTWVAAMQRDGARAVAFPMLGGSSPSEAAQRIVDAFADELGRATVVRVLATGSSARLALHLAPLNGAPLIEHAPVTWSVDVPRVTSVHATGRGGLVVADPASMSDGLGSLDQASREADLVTSVLAAREIPVQRLEGDAAQATRVLHELADAAWFHYAGHGQRDDADVWESALPMAGEGRLTARDIVTVARSPTTVVLNGCETADQRSGGGISLATAFVLAGAEGVIGAAAALADDDAADMAAALYASPGPEGIDAAFRRAVLDGARRGRTWPALIRLVTP
jgi:tetratricopeptide (TPR) repeat protein